MDVIFITSSSALAWVFLRTTCEATVGQAAFAMTTGFILMSMVITNI